MPGSFTPYIEGYQGSLITFDGYQTSSLAMYSVPAEDINNSSADELQGRYHGPSGTAKAPRAITYQDTSLASGRNVGTIFNCITGSAFTTDTWVGPWDGAYGLLYDSGASGGAFEYVEATPNDAIPEFEAIIARGPRPNGLTPTSTNFYAYLHLNYQGSQGDYRIAFVWGVPIGLDWAPDGVTWQRVASARQLGNCDRLFSTHPLGLAIYVEPHHEDNYISIEIGNGDWLTHAIPGALQSGQGDPTFGSFLPYGGSRRWVGSNGFASLLIFPYASGSVTLTAHPRNYGVPQHNANSAFVVANGRTNTPADQSLTTTIDTDGANFGFTVQAQRDLNYSPRLTDAVGILPASYSFDDLPGLSQLPIEMVEMVQNLNDQQRTFTTRGTITVANQFGEFTGALGRALLLLSGSNDGGDSVYPVFRGVLNFGPANMKFTTYAGRSFAEISFQDYSAKMTSTIDSDFVADGYAVPTFARAAGELGKIHPQFLQTLPSYVPPNAPSFAPYGPAGADYNGYILPRGSGKDAKIRFGPETPAWAMAVSMAGELADQDPVTGRLIPYYTGFRQPDAQFIFESYDPFSILPACYFSDTGEPGTIPIRNVFQVVSDVSQMRTGVTFEGQDPSSNVLNYVHLEQSADVQRVLGWPSYWTERGARYGPLMDLEYKANLALVKSGIPDQLLLFDAAYYLPWLQAGMVVIVSCSNPSMVGIGPYVVIAKLDRWGFQIDGTAVCSSSLVCRTLYAYI